MYNALHDKNPFFDLIFLGVLLIKFNPCSCFQHVNAIVMLTAAPTMKQKDMEFVMIVSTTQQGICVNFVRRPFTETQLYHRIPPILVWVNIFFFDDSHSVSVHYKCTCLLLGL